MKRYEKEAKVLLKLRDEARSHWQRGVLNYAIDFVDFLEENNRELNMIELLNGARDWGQYSWGAAWCALIYNDEICIRLCSEKEKRKTDYGAKRPNANEEWLDVQARALSQAADLLIKIHEQVKKEG